MGTIYCDDPKHPQRSTLPGWQDDLGTTTAVGHVSGYLCTACARQRKVEAVADANHDENQIMIYPRSGLAVARRPKAYTTGEIVDWVEKRAFLAGKLTAAEITTLRTLLAKFF